LLLQVGLLLRAIRSRMTVFSANGALYCGVGFCLERTSPGSVTFLLAILAIIVIDSLHLKVKTIQKFFKLSVFLSIKDLLDFLNSLLELLIIISDNDYVERLIVLEDVLLSFVSSSTSNGYFAGRSLLDQFLCAASRTDDFSDVICL
jgi:hypothetical protein